MAVSTKMAEQWLVSPSLVAYSIASAAQLEAVIELHGYKGNNAGNLRQLAGLNRVGADRFGRHIASGWQRYEAGMGSSKSAQCIMRDGTDIVFVLVGDVDDRWRSAKEIISPDVEREKLRRLLNGSLKALHARDDVWRRAELPPLSPSSNGASIAVLQAQTLAPPAVLLDYGACAEQHASEYAVGSISATTGLQRFIR